MKTIKQIIKNKELRVKVLITILMLVLYKIGTMLTLPTVAKISPANDSNLLTMMNYLSGSYVGRFTFLSLGLSPYITASIVIQLLGMGVIKPFERWKDEGEAGKKKTDKATFIFAIVLSLLEAAALVYSFDKTYGMLKQSTALYYILTCALLFIGSLLTMLMAKVITKKGIGNGSSLIIFAGIAARIGYDIFNTGKTLLNYSSLKHGLTSTGLFGLYLLFFAAIMGFIVFIDKSYRNIKIQYPKQSNQFSNQSSKIPIKVCLGGVVPVIFTVSIMTGFAYAGAYLKQGWLTTLGNYSNNFIGLSVYVILIMLFTMFYATEVFNAKTIAKNVKKSNATIVGKLPGEETEEYLDGIVKDVSVIGGVALCIIAIIPILVSMLFPSLSLSLSLGGTSMMILAGVASETYGQIKAKLNTVKSTSLKLFD